MQVSTSFYLLGVVCETNPGLGLKLIICHEWIDGQFFLLQNNILTFRIKIHTFTTVHNRGPKCLNLRITHIKALNLLFLVHGTPDYWAHFID